MNNLNFTNKYYKEKAINLKQNIDEIHSPSDAFLLLINGVKKEDLNNLCYMIQLHFNKTISLNNCYNLTQNQNIDKKTKELIYKLAKLCIKSGLPLGSKTINNGKINTSDWISHSIYVSEVCSTLASALQLSQDKAETLGLLHDFGRKYDHTFSHVIKGFEALVDLGWINEATSCLTHSFVYGGRCANNETAIEGFYIDDEGNPQWKENTKKDNLTEFLETYKYSDYDLILNVADLMATSKSIVPPHKRIKDIATRRNIDPINRKYFLSELINLQFNILNKLGFIEENLINIKPNKNTTIEELEIILNNTSTLFFNIYTEIKKEILNSKKNNTNSF